MMICQAALEREESRGQHSRRDHPERKDRDGRRWITVSLDNDLPRLGSVDIPVPIQAFSVAG
jgi:succinate dehydrogenase/fumarate reductase flavoprotein subunit